MKRIFAFFLSLLLILGICPMSALADTGGSGNVDGGAAAWDREPRRIHGIRAWTV